MKKLTMLGFALLAFGCMAWATEGSWVGVVSDSHCMDKAKHMKADDEAAGCVKKCVEGGAKYVLVSKGKVYQLDPQEKFADHAGHRVKVKGEMKGDTIAASDVAMAPAKKAKAAM